MDAKTLEIVKAGWAMFARYGFAKTTMSDIASEAGVARQTVYNAFSSKEDILRAVVRHAGEMSLADVKAAWADQGSLSEKLDSFQRLGPMSWFEAIQSAPDWGQLMDGVHRGAANELEALQQEWVRALTQMLKETLAEGKPVCDLEEAAEFFYVASKNAKYGARDLDDLSRRLNTINKAMRALLSE